jgi:S-DNA-T family DNA segregation ATPase FtsK/SpoIIIE
VARARNGSKSGRKAKESESAPRRFFRFVATPPARRLILLVAVVVLLYFAWDRMFSLLGYGLVLIAIVLGLLVWVVWQQRYSVLKRRWNWILGGISLFFAVWGMLALSLLGGRFGQSIVGGPGATAAFGGLVVAGLILAGVIFVIPRRFVTGIRSGWHLLNEGYQLCLAVISRWRARAKAVPVQTALPVTEAAGEAETADAQRPERSAPPAWKSEHEPILTPGGWHLPPIDILDKPVEMKLDKDAVDQRARLIEEALESYGVEAKVVQINIGPTVTQFGVEPGWDRKYKDIKEKGKDGSYETKSEEVSRTRVRVERITSLANDLALALAAPSIRIEAPVPGAPVVGIEVPNTVFGSVAIRGAIESTAFQKIRARSKLAIALGKGAGGEAVAADLAKMPHLLIAGATGSGKTVCLNSIISCLLLHNSPDDVRFIMIDPKRVELVTFNGVPQLLAPVVVDTDMALKSLRWLNQEMDRRYREFAKAGARNIEGYNKDRAPGEGLAYLVLLIDELADLMMTSSDEVEHTLCRLAQLSRATGIHLVVATQRPSVDVVTGLIKANFPTRISFAVTSQVDSRTILDMVGAEKLLGRGDMLYMPTEAGKPKRLQGSFISDAEIERLVYFWGGQREIPVKTVDFGEVTEGPLGGQITGPPDPLLAEAKQLAQEYKHLSTSFLQRRLRIGYPRAARLMEALGQAGLVEEGLAEEDKS